MKTRLLFISFLALLTCLPAWSLTPDEILEDPALEQRAREISRELRCVTCQSQSIDDSDAPLAHDLRVIVRERLVAGDSDAEVVAYITERYGDYVRLKPALRADTIALWFTPVILLLIAGGFTFFYFRRMNQNGNTLSVGDSDTDELEF